jgi:hypothetical protein
VTRRDDGRRREARKGRLRIAPQLAAYDQLENVFWPFLLSVSRPGASDTVVSTDSRGHRVTRVGAESVRSDAAPDGAGFLLGGSFSFGVGASDDEHTVAAELWRRTGVPYVNLGIRAATSMEELVGVLPFVERGSSFVVCSGLNNLACAGLARLADERARPVDRLFGPTYDEARVRTLTGFSLRRLARLAGDAVGTLDDRALRAELRRRRGVRMHERLKPLRRFRKRVRGKLAPGAPAPADAPPPGGDALGEVVAEAAARQLRDLRLLRRLARDDAPVVFALQPIAWSTRKKLSPEEKEIFGLLDAIQPLRWSRLKELLERRWGDYAAALERGCAAAGVPFVDLARGDYSGWCFVDRIHMTDRGYEGAAAVLEEVL